MVNILSAISEFSREGYTRADLAGWQGKALVVATEDDTSFQDLEWFTENLPSAGSHTFPKGLGHPPQLVHGDKIESLIRGFLGQLP